jgi:thiamine-monophosphate kinase
VSAATHLGMGEGAEFDAIRRLLAVWGTRATGIGDDAAILDIPPGQRLVVSTDASVQNVHFRREWLSAEEIGGRAAAAALSDIAAMAASPLGMLLALAVPDDWRSELEALARGVGRIASAAGGPILGGNISKASELSLTLTVLGSASRPLERRGAVAGDDIYVTGQLGGPGAALRSWLGGGTPSPEHRARFASPAPRLREARWLADRGAHAAIDISDGLLADGGHLAVASGVSIVIDENNVPRLPGVSVEEALTSGEEYELLVAMPHGAIDVIEFEREFALKITVIGTAILSEAPIIRGRSGLHVQLGGHDHLA